MLNRSVSRILVPLDGSTRAEGAVPYASAIAGGIGAEIIFVSVASGETDVLDIEFKRMMIRSPHTARWMQERDLVVLSGKPSVAIVEFAERREVDLIAMTTRGLTGTGKGKLGSVLDEVLISSSVPVLAARAEEDATNLETSRPIDHIIVPVDGSVRSLVVEEIAVKLAIATQAKVSLYHVTTGAEPDFEVFKELRDLLVSSGIDVDIVVHEGDPKTCIRDFAGLSPGTLVVMCSRGPRSVADRPLGSVADYVIRHSKTPVVVVPAVDDRFITAVDDPTSRDHSDIAGLRGGDGADRGAA